jgi:hypothetical protein
VGFSVRSTDEAFLDLVRAHLAPLRVGELPHRTGTFSASCAEDRVLPGGKRTRGLNNLYFGMMRIYRGPYREEMLGRLLSAGRDVLTNGQDEFVLLRAGAVAIDGQALVLPSRPEPHLAALTALLVEHGARFLGEGVVKLDPVLRKIHPMTYPILVHETDVTLFPSLADQPVRRLQREEREKDALRPPRPVGLEALNGTAAEAPTPVGWIVFPDFVEGAKDELLPAGGSQMVFRLSEAALNLHVWRDRALILMRDVLQEAPVSRLIVGSLPEAAEVLMRSAPDILEGVSA